jgi:putative endonuclease
MYILQCADGSYYTGSTINLERRLAQHQAGEGAKHTKKRLPVKLVYCEYFDRIQDAFYREKQVQGWSKKKKEALIRGDHESLKELSQNYTQYPRETKTLPSTGSGSEENNPLPSTGSGSGENKTLPELLPELAEGSSNNKNPKKHE